MRRRPLATLVLALLLGAVAALGSVWLISTWRQAQALRRIVHEDPDVRDGGWTWLLATARDGGLPRVVALGDALDARLATGGDAAVLHGAVALGGRGRWDWTRRDAALVARALPLLATDERRVARELALDLLVAAPLDLDAATMRDAARPLVAGDDAVIRQRAFAVALGWAGRDRAALAGDLPPPSADPTLCRRRLLALSWATPPLALDPVPADAPAPVREADLLRRTLERPDDAAPILAALGAADADAMALDAILGHSRAPAARRTLEQRAGADRRGARLVLAALRPDDDRRQARRAALDPGRPLAARRLAAWRWGAPPVDLVRALLAASPADAGGAVTPAVLLAERALPPTEAVALAEQWIRSFDDDAKRAGALLAALLGAHRDLLVHAADLEDVPRVRSLQRLALRGFGTTASPGDDTAVAARHLRPDGEPDPDVVLALLLGGAPEALAAVCAGPTGAPATWGPAVQWRAMVVERTVPAWHEDAGRPVGSSAAALRLHFDRLEARRQLDARRLRFDPATRTYAVAPASATPVAPAAE